MGNFRYTCSTMLVLIGSVWISACGESEHLQRARDPDADTKTILTSYAKHRFSKAEIEVNVWDDHKPPLYGLDVDQFRLSWSSSSLRTTFTNNVSSIMRRISEDERLKKYKGRHQFSAYVETENIRGVTDTTRAIYFVLPNDLDVVWDAMSYDAPKFLKFLYYEQESNRYVNVKFHPQLRPDYWR